MDDFQLSGEPPKDGRVLESIEESENFLAIHFTDGSSIVCRAECSGEHGFGGEVDFSQLDEKEIEHLGLRTRRNLKLIPEGQYRFLLEQAEKKAREQKEEYERKQLAELKKKYEAQQ